jgi:hypothetical protein
MYGKKLILRKVVKMIQPSKRYKTVASIILFLTIAFFITACQPTPEEAVIVGKGDGVSDLIQSSEPSSSVTAKTDDALYTKLEVPQHWRLEETALDGRLNIVADADIELPNVLQLPVATASLSGFSQEDLDKIAEVLGVKGATWTEAGVQTKEEIEAYLIERKADLAKLKSANAANDSDAIQKAEESIAYNEQRYIDAPYESELKNIEFKISGISNGGLVGVGFQGVTQLNDQPFYFNASGYSNNGVDRIYSNYGSVQAGFGGVGLDKPYNVSLTKEQAAEQASEIAEQLTDELSLCYMTPAATNQQEIFRNWGWACVFMREINGCPTAYESTEIGYSLDAMNAPVTYEKMIIIMDDMGMVSLTWEIPMTIESIDNPDVSLLPFDKISQRALEQISQRYADMVDENIDSNGIDWGDPGCTANITKVELGLMRIAKANSNDYYYIPVWKFFIDLEHTAEYYERTNSEPLLVNEDENNFINIINYEYSLRCDVITVSALDGSVIDGQLGY